MEGMVAAAAAGVAAEGGVDDQLEGEEGREGSQEEECGEKVEEPVAEGGLGWLAVALQFRWVQTAWSEELLYGWKYFYQELTIVCRQETSDGGPRLPWLSSTAGQPEYVSTWSKRWNT